ncbi:entericidin A/B family lipoprotein [Sphingomonas sp.]|nr:entericidin A/B family lipoprotein [Sphingomonas sp.]HWK35337.1 entericidin A/B family lipoprotein [Sphingomonas sp.]
MRKITTAIALATILTLAACNTVEGVGKDVKSAGETVANTADDAK